MQTAVTVKTLNVILIQQAYILNIQAKNLVTDTNHAID